MILVTGATGHVGRAVVAALEEADRPYRIAARDPQAARAALGVDAPAVALDFHEPATFAPALQGITGLFLLRPPAISDVDPTLNRLVDVGAGLALRHVVFLSVAGVEQNRWVPHRAVEDHLRTTALAWTFLRPGFFTQNLASAYREDIVEDDRIHVPAGDGAVPWVDTRDLGVVAARAFADPALRDRALTLTGPEALDFHQVADLLADELDRPIAYEPASLLGYPLHLRRRGAPWGQALIQTVLHTLIRLGRGGEVDPTLARLLDRPPRTLRDYVRDHRALFAARAAAG